MSQILSLIRDLGDDADLLTHSDTWLDSQYLSAAQHMNRLAQELNAIRLAQRIKMQLSQRNVVAVQKLVRDDNDCVVDLEVRLMDLPDAIRSLSDVKDGMDTANRQAQLHGWKLDGHDLAAAAALRN